jgi:SAM-dependent methyltransferase
MGADYSNARRTKPHLKFRLKSRALVAVEAFKRYCPDRACESLVDFGAAEGATLVEVHQALSAKTSLGIEYAAELIAQARGLPDGCRLVQGDVTAPHPDVDPESQDLVLALAVLEHLDSPAGLFQQAHRVLKPGGILVATCPSGFWDGLSGLLRLHPEEHHEQDFNRAMFEELAQGAGLESLRYERFMFAPVAFLPYLRVPVSARLARGLDRGIGALRVLNFGFVNQVFVARKPRD